MNETGEVISADNNSANVRFVRSSMCGSCGACGISKDQQEIVIEAENAIGAKSGDVVRVSIDTRKALKASAIAYLIPLAFLVVGVFAGWLIGDATEVFSTPEIMAAIVGIAFCVLAFIALYFIDKKIGGKLKKTYRLIEIIEDQKQSNE